MRIPGQDTDPPVQDSQGFTLVEMLLSLAVGAVLLALAAPLYTGLVHDARMTSAVNAFVHGIHVARHQSQALGADLVLCRSSSGEQCTPGTPWRDGYLVFVNRDRDSPPRVDSGEPILQRSGPFDGAILANREVFVFRPYGLRSVNGTITLCDRRGQGAARAVIVSYTGRPRAVRAADSEGAIRCTG